MIVLPPRDSPLLHTHDKVHCHNADNVIGEVTEFTYSDGPGRFLGGQWGQALIVFSDRGVWESGDGPEIIMGTLFVKGSLIIYRLGGGK